MARASCARSGLRARAHTVCARPFLIFPRGVANEALNVCASTARKIEEVAERNRIREEAGLPVLSIPRELRRMIQTAHAMELRGESRTGVQPVLWKDSRSNRASEKSCGNGLRARSATTIEARGRSTTEIR